MHLFGKTLIFLLFVAYSTAYSQVGGQSIYQFLNIPASARATALGGNALSINDNDLNLALINPALLSDTMTKNMAINYINHFADVNYGYFAFAKNIRKDENYSIGVQYLNYGDFIRTDDVGNQIGSFTANEVSLNVSYARPIIDSSFRVGATLKSIYSGLDSYSSFGSALDVGVLYDLPIHDFSAAFLIKNVGYEWKSYVKGQRENLPFEMQLGLSKKAKHVPFRFSLVYENIEKWDLTYTSSITTLGKIDPITGKTIEKGRLVSFGDKLMRHIVLGGEFILSKNFFIRAGYNYQRRQELKIAEKRGMVGFSFGFGLRVYKFHLSFGRAMYSLAGPSNTFSLTFNLNSFHQKSK